MIWKKNESKAGRMSRERGFFLRNHDSISLFIYVERRKKPKLVDEKLWNEVEWILMNTHVYESIQKMDIYMDTASTTLWERGKEKEIKNMAMGEKIASVVSRNWR